MVRPAAATSPLARPPVGFGGFGDQQCRSAPLADQREALTEPHQRQQHWRYDAHLMVGPQLSDDDPTSRV